METFRVNERQTLINVHKAGDCLGPWCVIHNPAPGPWQDWRLIWRPINADDEMFGLYQGFERICPHEYGHPAVEEVLRGNTSVHGCDGCPCGPQHIEEESA